MILPHEKPVAYQKLGAAILKSAINDLIGEDPRAANESWDLLFGEGYHACEHREWIMDLIGCDKPAMLKRIASVRQFPDMLTSRTVRTETARSNEVAMQ